jgi:hypothetical protein
VPDKPAGTWLSYRVVMDEPRTAHRSGGRSLGKGRWSGRTLLWVYGSLMDQRSVLRTLVHRDEPVATSTQRVTGWRRAWNCLSSKTFLDASGARVRRVVMGIEAAPGVSCHGVLLDLGDGDLGPIRVREQAYEEFDITAFVEAPARRVITFVPRPERLRSGVAAGMPLVVERRYFDSCVQGAVDHRLPGVADEMRATLDLPLADPAGEVRLVPPERPG